MAITAAQFRKAQRALKIGLFLVAEASGRRGVWLRINKLERMSDHAVVGRSGNGHWFSIERAQSLSSETEVQIWEQYTESLAKRQIEVDPQLNVAEARLALQQLIMIGQGGHGRASRIVSNFLLAWWNPERCGSFDLRELEDIPAGTAQGIASALALLPQWRQLPDEFDQHFNRLVRLWRPPLGKANRGASSRGTRRKDKGRR